MTENNSRGSLLDVVDKRSPWPHLKEKIRWGRTGRDSASRKVLIEVCIRGRFGISEATI
jgi:hypothetical protein